MRVVALGTSAAYPGPGNACTGWLVQEEGTNLVVDCGTGVLATLQRLLPLTQITAIVVSHMHADHFLDLIPLRYAFRYGVGRGLAGPRIYLPPEGHQKLQRMVEPLLSGGADSFFSAVFDVREYDPVAPCAVGPLNVSFAPGNHYIPCWAIAVQGRRRVVFTSDTGPCGAVERLARGADLLVSEATYLSLEEEDPSRRGHLTAREAGELAARASPRRVLLTHLWPHRDLQQTLQEARATFRGDIEVAQPGCSYEL